MKAAKGSQEWQNYLAFMTFESTFINVFQRGDRIQKNFPAAEHPSAQAPPLKVKSRQANACMCTHTHAYTHTHTEGARDLSQKELDFQPRTQH